MLHSWFIMIISVSIWRGGHKQAFLKNLLSRLHKYSDPWQWLLTSWAWCCKLDKEDLGIFSHYSWQNLSNMCCHFLGFPRTLGGKPLAQYEVLRTLNQVFIKGIFLDGGGGWDSWQVNGFSLVSSEPFVFNSKWFMMCLFPEDCCCMPFFHEDFSTGLGASKHPIFMKDRSHCVLQDFWSSTQFFQYSSPAVCLNTMLSLRSTDNSSHIMACLLLCHALSAVEPCGALYRQSCAFPSHVQWSEFTTARLKSIPRKNSRTISENRDGLSFSSVVAHSLTFICYIIG